MRGRGRNSRPQDIVGVARTIAQHFYDDQPSYYELALMVRDGGGVNFKEAMEAVLAVTEQTVAPRVYEVLPAPAVEVATRRRSEQVVFPWSTSIRVR